MRSLLFLLLLLVAMGCENPYVCPDSAKAASEIRQEKIEERKAKAMEEQAAQLKRIADYLERQGK